MGWFILEFFKIIQGASSVHASLATPTYLQSLELMKKLLQVLINPFLLPILPAVVIIALIAGNISPYHLELKDRRLLRENETLWYGDITNDGYSEYVTILDGEDRVSVKVEDHRGRVFRQWNFLGSLENIRFSNVPIMGDHNHDGNNLLFIFTMSGDSLLLHRMDLTKDLETEPDYHGRFITRVGYPGYQPDPRVRGTDMADLTGDGKKELIFNVSAGFVLRPRNVYAYIIEEDSLMKSPTAVYSLRDMRQADLTGNGKPEILLSGSSTGNIDARQHHFHDSSNWLMVMDQDLDFLFEPLEIPGPGNRINVYDYLDDAQPMIAAVELRHNHAEHAKVHVFYPDGRKKFSVSTDAIYSRAYQLPQDNGLLLALSGDGPGTILYDPLNDKIIRKLDMPLSGQLVSRDITGDGRPEMISPDISNGHITVFRNNLTRHVNISEQIDEGRFRSLHFIERPGEIPLIHVQSDQFAYTLRYAENPHYSWAVAYFAGIYAVFFLFGMVTRAYQKNQLSKKQAIEKKITELQLNLVKNQLSPHFSLNAINAAIHTIKKEETEKAADYLRRFSRLHRAMVLSAEQMHRTLADEIQFTVDYVEIEKLRFDHAFAFEIEVADHVDQQTNIPKMILQSHAENAIKHGLSGKKGDGLLRIRIEQHHRTISVKISDNGVGRAQASEAIQDSTGRGYKMMQEYYRLYNKYYHMHITQQIQDLYDQEGSAAGTSVEIMISLRNA